MRKRVLMITAVLLGCLMVGVAFGQTGVNTRLPHTSSALEVASADKGVLLPRHTLIDLVDNVNPVNDPQVGSLIYNEAGSHPKGYYYWDGEKWDRLIINYELDQLYRLGVAGTWRSSPEPDDSKQLIPMGTGDNIINFGTSGYNTQVVSTMPGASYSGQNINLPAGKYKVEVSLDCISPASPASGSLVGLMHLYALDAAILNSVGTPITDIKTVSSLSGSGGNSIQRYGFSFIIDLPTPQVVRLRLRHGAGRTTTAATRTNQSGLQVVFRRLFEEN